MSLESQLHVACRKGDLIQVKSLLQNKTIDINKKGLLKFTGLIYACRNDHSEVIKLLLNDQRMDDVNTGDEGGNSAFHWVCMRGKLQALKVLLQDNKVDVNKRNNYGQTGLMLACKEGHLEIIQWIFASRKEIDLHVIRCTGHTAMDDLRQRLETSESEEQKEVTLKIIELFDKFFKDLMKHKLN